MDWRDRGKTREYLRADFCAGILQVKAMGSDSDTGEDPTFTDCQASGSESASGMVVGRKRQISMHEMVQKAEGRRPKRRAAARQSQSPADRPAPAAAEGAGGAGSAPGPVQLSAATLAEIKRLIDHGNANVIRTLETKLEGMERRLTVLESECMDKDGRILELSRQLKRQTKVNEELETRLEELDMNGRLSSLILSCDAFKTHPRSADIEQLVVSVLNERVSGLTLTTADLQAAHKLQSDSKVICKFAKRQTRDAVFEARFDLARFRKGNPGRDGLQLAPLYITESLTPRNRLLYEELLRAKRPENGGLVASVFSRRGVVWCRTERGGANLRVHDEAALRRILGGRRVPAQPRAPQQRGAPPPSSSAERRPPAPGAGAAGRSVSPRAAAAAPAPPGPTAGSAVSGPRGAAEHLGDAGSAAGPGSSAPLDRPSADASADRDPMPV